MSYHSHWLLSRLSWFGQGRVSGCHLAWHLISLMRHCANVHNNPTQRLLGFTLSAQHPQLGRRQRYFSRSLCGNVKEVRDLVSISEGGSTLRYDVITHGTDSHHETLNLGHLGKMDVAAQRSVILQSWLMELDSTTAIRNHSAALRDTPPLCHNVQR